MDEINPLSKFLSSLISFICGKDTISVPGIVCGTIWGSFAVQFGDHLRYWDHLRAGIICGAVHITLASLLSNSHSPSYMLVRTITIAKSLSSICSVMAMKDCLLQAQLPSSQPLFAFVRPRQWLTRSNLTELTTILQYCGLPASNFYSPSFCIGSITTAAKAGLSPWLITVLGCWSSDCYEHYIRSPKFLEVPRLLANTSP